MPYKTTEAQRRYWKEYRQKNKEHRKQLLKDWRKANPEKLKAQNQRYYERSKERQNEYGKRYYKENKERIKKRHATYYQSNRGSFAVRSAKWREENLERAKEYIKEWSLKNPDKRRASASKRLALVRGASVTKTDIAKLLETMTCGICGMVILDKYHIDHIIPVSKGGKHIIENLQLTHPICNLRKGATLPV